MSEIKVGMKFKNENYLLKYLDLYNTNTTKNNKKKEQLKNFLEWELTGKKSRGKTTKEIIITKILEYPIDKMDGRKDNGKNSNSHGNNKKRKYYTELSSTLLLLSTTNELSITKKQLMIHLGMTTRNFTEFSTSNKNTKEVIHMITRKQSDILNKNLLYMQQDNLISYEYLLYYKKGNEEHVATPVEEEAYVTIQNSAKDNINRNTMANNIHTILDLELSGKLGEYKNAVYKKMNKELGWDKAYYKYWIRFNTKDNGKNMRKELNDKIIKEMNRSIKQKDELEQLLKLLKVKEN